MAHFIQTAWNQCVLFILGVTFSHLCPFCRKAAVFDCMWNWSVCADREDLRSRVHVSFICSPLSLYWLGGGWGCHLWLYAALWKPKCEWEKVMLRRRIYQRLVCECERDWFSECWYLNLVVDLILKALKKHNKFLALDVFFSFFDSKIDLRLGTVNSFQTTALLLWLILLFQGTNFKSLRLRSHCRS